VKRSGEGCKASTSAWIVEYSLKRHQDIKNVGWPGSGLAVVLLIEIIFREPSSWELYRLAFKRFGNPRKPRSYEEQSDSPGMIQY